MVRKEPKKTISKINMKKYPLLKLFFNDENGDLKFSSDYIIMLYDRLFDFPRKLGYLIVDYIHKP